jgi:hypothetical protein
VALAEKHMTNVFTLTDAIVDSLRGIAALVALMGDEDQIYAHKHTWPASVSWMLALREAKTPSIMVLWRATRTGTWGNIPSRAHDFSLLILPGANASIADIWEAIINGGFQSAADIHADVEMIQDPTCELRTLAVTENGYLDYWEAQFSLTEKFC